MQRREVQIFSQTKIKKKKKKKKKKKSLYYRNCIGQTNL